MLGAEFALLPDDPDFAFIEHLPVVHQQFDGHLRWHCQLTPRSSGPLFSFHTGAAATPPIYNLISRPDCASRVVVFHCRGEFKTRDAMAVYLAGMWRVYSSVVQSRMVVLCVRARAAVGATPAAAAPRIFAKYAGFVVSDVVFFAAAGRNGMERTLVNSIQWHVEGGRAAVNLQVFPNAADCRLWMDEVCGGCCPTAGGVGLEVSREGMAEFEREFPWVAEEEGWRRFGRGANETRIAACGACSCLHEEAQIDRDEDAARDEFQRASKKGTSRLERIVEELETTAEDGY